MSLERTFWLMALLPALVPGIVWGAYDVIALIRGWNTVSESVWWAIKSAGLPLLVIIAVLVSYSFVEGHLFWQASK